MKDPNCLVLGTPGNLGLVLYEIWETTYTPSRACLVNLHDDDCGDYWELVAELEGSLIWKMTMIVTNLEGYDPSDHTNFILLCESC